MKKTIAMLFAVIMMSGCSTNVPREIAMPAQTACDAPEHPDKLSPLDYDKWFGKKPRIYLQGMWRFKELDGTLGKPDDTSGEHAGFAKPEFDDSQWQLQPVPGDWNANRKENLSVPYDKENYFGGVAWYRAKFQIPEMYKDLRILLHFGKITFESEIYVNGVKVGAHTNIMRAYYSKDDRGGADDITLDITSCVKPGAENTVAVKVYMDRDRSLSGGGRGPSAGIVWPAWLEIAPLIYMQNALITPDLQKSSIKVAAAIVNSLETERQVVLSARTCAWKSYRYQAPGQDVVTSAKVWEGTLKPGVNKINFNMKIKDPVEWNLQKPFLYHFKLFLNGELIGQERFGFREFTTSGSDFLLNGKKIYLAGSLVQISSLMSTGPWYGERGRLQQIFNKDGFLERMLKTHHDANLNILRPHSTHMQPVFYDLLDEIGTLVNEEMYPGNVRKKLLDKDDYYLFDKDDYSWYFSGGKLAAKYTSYLQHRMDVIHNNPSVVLFSIGNELYDTLAWGGHGAPEGRSWAPFINAVYDEIKAYYPELLLSSSGRTPPRGLYPGWRQDKSVKGDYYDVHNYTGCYHHPWTFLPREIEYYFKEYTKEGIKPVINGEFLLRNYNEFHGRRGRKEWLDKDGRLSKAKYLLLENNQNEWWSAPKWHGYRVLLSEEANYQVYCDHYKEVIEMYRRNKQYCAGFEILSPPLYKRYQEKMFELAPLFYTLKQVCNPTFVCLDLFDKNVFAGKELNFNIYLFNELPGALKNVTVKIELQGGNLKHAQSLDVGNLANGEKKIIPFKYDMPSACFTGEGALKLEMYADDRKVSENEYNFFVLGEDRMRKSIPADKKIALFMAQPGSAGVESPGKTAEIMDSLGIKYTRALNMDGLAQYDVLIVAQNSMAALGALNAGDKIVGWLEKGGRILCFEQNERGDIPFLPGMMNASSGETVLADVYDMGHPIFKDLNWWNFRRWNGVHGTVSSCYQLPLNMGLLAASSGSHNKYKWGMAISEIGVGEGRVLSSSLLATAQYMQDSVATKFIQNLLAYCLGNSLVEKVWQLEVKDQAKKTVLDLKVDDKKTLYVDLREIANMGFRDDNAGDKKGGWTDQGPENDLRDFKPGIRKFLGVPFDIIEPQGNNGKACVVLYPSNGELAYKSFLPSEKRFVVDKTQVKRIFFLVASAWSKDTIGEIIINLEGAAAPSVTVPLTVGVNLSDWGAEAQTLPDGYVAWTSQTGKSIYLIEWKNPESYCNIRNIEFKAVGKSIAILLGVTVETQ